MPDSGMPTLLILRHAKAVAPYEAPNDHDRPLKKRGRKDAARVGQRLSDQESWPDRILCSTSRRTVETVECMARAIDSPKSELILLDDLYLADARTMLALLANQPQNARCVLMVAHNPGIEELIWTLTGRHEPVPTATLAHLAPRLDSWSEIDPSTTASLVGIWRPGQSDERGI